MTPPDQTAGSNLRTGFSSKCRQAVKKLPGRRFPAEFFLNETPRPIRATGHDSRYRWAIGIRRPTPNALLVTFNPGAAWRRLYSFESINRTIRFTVGASKPPAMISAADLPSTTYASRMAGRNSGRGGREGH